MTFGLSAYISNKSQKFNTYIISWLNFAYYAVATRVYHQTAEDVNRELEIIKKCQQSPEHFAPIYRKYYEDIFYFVFKRVDNEELTADITSRVFLKSLKNIKKFRFQGVPFSAWLYKIAINEINSFFRQQKKVIRSVNIEDDDIRHLVTEIDHNEPKIDPYVLIPVLLEQLNEREIQFIELRFFENHSFREMAYLLELTEVNAKVKTYRILKKLKKIAAEVKYN